MAFLQDESVWNADNLREYIENAPAEILKNSYSDSYYLSYELMQSAQSAEKRFSTVIDLDSRGRAGSYQRNLSMTQHELDAIIVSAVKEYDNYKYTGLEYGAQPTLCEKSEEDLKRVRNRMLSITIEDLKGYAGFIDGLAAQNRVFAILGKKAADNAVFPFAYYADASNLEITPRMNKELQPYINRKTNTLFAPDDYVTRVETAAFISRLLGDPQKPELENSFEDVSADAWYDKKVLSVLEKDMMNGYGEDTNIISKKGPNRTVFLVCKYMEKEYCNIKEINGRI